jgi:hypothetical protein
MTNSRQVISHLSRQSLNDSSTLQVKARRSCLKELSQEANAAWVCTLQGAKIDQKVRTIYRPMKHCQVKKH